MRRVALYTTVLVACFLIAGCHHGGKKKEGKHVAMKKCDSCGKHVVTADTMVKCKPCGEKCKCGEMVMRCPKCKAMTKVADAMTHCDKCKTTVLAKDKMKCSKCGAKLSTHDMMCAKCAEKP